jgi:hypothetical protein
MGALNGLVGRVVRYDAAAGRYTVAVRHEELAVKPANLARVE